MEDLDYSQQIRLSCRFIEKKWKLGVVEKIIRNIESNKEGNLVPETDIKETFSEKNSNFDLNRIYNIDCLEFMRNTKDNSIDLIFADPPYNLSKSNFKMKFTRSGGSDLNTNKGELGIIFQKMILKNLQKIGLLKHLEF